jgi:saccharopine dehydrogenase-like NADP-dependent oxidoreductase
MKDVVVIGAGNIGSMLADWLSGTGDYRVTVADKSATALRGMDLGGDIVRAEMEVSDTAAVTALLDRKFAVLSAAPFYMTTSIATAARAAGAHYLDLTEDVASTRTVRKLAEGAASAFIPQCGLAPGFITIVAHDIAQRFDSLQDVRMRVGGAARVPVKRAELQPDLINRRSDQRVLRTLRGDRQRYSSLGAAPGRAPRILARRRPV